jgi:hypothetical protein
MKKVPFVSLNTCYSNITRVTKVMCNTFGIRSNCCMIKVKKVNIRTVENAKMAIIGDYCDEETVKIIIKLLREYNDMFPTTFMEMKGIAGELGEMNILLRAEAISIKQQPYKLNMIYKQKSKAKIDKMFEARIIEPVEESEWVSPMVVQGKKKGGIRICVDLRKMNDACLHDMFPTPFTYEVLENVGGWEAYSFINGFSQYH